MLTINGTTRYNLNGRDLCAVCQITWSTLHKLVEGGIIDPIDEHGPRQHWRFPASAAVTIRNLRKLHGRHFVKKALQLQEPTAEQLLTPDEPTPVADYGAGFTSLAPEPTPERRVDNVTLMLYGLDERLQAIHATLGDLVAAVNRCAAAWER